ncbi:N-acetylneuraminate synthase [Paenibacillus sp. GCM10027628]|uniref:N-acetylneuraminate synthase n=1 Tax=Paenibacillus sp. GCM10027628 TaxID=3273413 RepID=UPI003631CE86
MKRTFIIAEAGVNHNGSLETAMRLIDTAADAGADAVKFQTFKTEKLVSKHAAKADYQKRLTNEDETQFEMLKKLELNHDDHLRLIRYCETRNIQFLSTPFDSDSVDLLGSTFGLTTLKLSSGDLTNAPLLLQISQMKKKVLLSTGMSHLGEIETALFVLAFGYLRQPTESFNLTEAKKAYGSVAGQQWLKEMVTLLHCTTEYPASFTEVNLKAMEVMRAAFGLGVGYSDHTVGITIPIAASALGAEVIEKHFTLDRNMQGPDHQASIEPKELQEMVKAIRDVDAALGTGIKVATASEIKNIKTSRKSIVAARPIRKGEQFSEINITIKRPGSGKEPIEYWNILGQVADRNYEQDENI